MGLVRGRVGVDGRSLGDAPIPGVRSRSGDSGLPESDNSASTRVGNAGAVEPTVAEEAFDDWADESYGDNDGTLDEGAPIEDAWDESLADSDAFSVDGEPSETAPTPGDANGDTAADVAPPTGGAAESVPENASDEPVAGERAPLGTWVRSVFSKAAMGRLGVFFNPVARFRELSAKDAGGTVAASPVRTPEPSSRAAVRDGDAGADEFDAEDELYPVVDDAAEGELPPVGDEDEDDTLGDTESDPLDDGDEENSDETEDAKSGASRAAAKRGSRSPGRGGRAIRAFVSLCRRVLGFLLWPLSFVSRFVSRLVARPLSFVVRLLSRVPVLGRVVRLATSVPRRVRRLLRAVAWLAVLCGVLFAFGWRPPFVPVSSGVAGVDLPDSGHLSVSAWRVDDETVNVHVVNDGETVVEGESVEVRASAWVPLSRLPWSLVARTDGGSCVVDIDVVDVEDAADFVVSCPAVGGLGESVVPVGSSFGE